MPKVSVIIPVYNTARYLRRCLDSVCGQTLQDIEIICVDDASTDGSADILWEYTAQDGRIRCIPHGHNRGCAAARNTGMDAARGTYISFIDSDDWIDAGFLEELATIAEREHIDIVYNSNIVLENEDGTTTRFEPGNFGNSIGFATTGYVDCHSNIGNFCYSNCCCLYLRAYLGKISVRYPEGLDYTDNYFQIVTFLYQHSIYITNVNKYHYIRHIDSICGENTTDIQNYDIIDVYGLIYRYYINNNFINKCKLNFYELSKFIREFKDKEYSYNKIHNLAIAMRHDVENNHYLYNANELRFLTTLVKVKNFYLFDYLFFKENSVIWGKISKTRKKIITQNIRRKFISHINASISSQEVNSNNVFHCRRKQG